jgi:hypothetical protein
MIVRRNYPYRGNADGLTTALRRVHGADRYVGIEVELNQRLLGSGGIEEMTRALIKTLKELV